MVLGLETSRCNRASSATSPARVSRQFTTAWTHSTGWERKKAWRAGRGATRRAPSRLQWRHRHAVPRQYGLRHDTVGWEITYWGHVFPGVVAWGTTRWPGKRI